MQRNFMSRLFLKNNFLRLLAVFVSAISLTATARADDKLGIALEQGYSTPYVTDIDPNGPAALSGLHLYDYIVEIGAVSIYTADQAKRFLNFQKTKGPFNILVKRNDTLHQVTIDLNRPPRKAPTQKVSDALTSCFLMPTQECMEVALSTVAESEDAVFSTWSGLTRAYHKSGWPEHTEHTLEQTKRQYMQTPNDKVWLNFSIMMGVLKDLGQKPDPELISFTEKAMLENKGPEDVGTLLDLASGFSEVSGELGVPYLNRAIAIIQKDPDISVTDAQALGKAIGYSGQVPYLKTVHDLKGFGREQSNELIQSVVRTRHHMGDRKNAIALQKTLVEAKQSWTTQDMVSFVEFAQEVHDLDLSRRMITKLTEQHSKAAQFTKGVVIYSLIKAHGLSGNIHMGRKLIDEHVNDPLIAMMDLTIAAGKSRSTMGGSVQFYKDFPKLITDTHALVKAASREELKAVRSLRFVNFYEVLAAHVGTTIQLSELNRYALSKFNYERIIDRQIEVRKFEQAFKFADHVASKFGSTFAYGSIASSLGSAGSDQQILAFTKHPSFAKYSGRSSAEYVERLYWKGDYESAVVVFESLNETQKSGLIQRQLPFLIGCPACDI